MALVTSLTAKLNVKKFRFAILSVTLICLAYYLAFGLTTSDPDTILDIYLLLKYVAFIGIVSIPSSLFVQYLEGGSKEFRMLLSSGLMPFVLIVGCLLFFIYYPNLSLLLKILAIAYYSVLLYTLLLLNNVLLVVESREVNIPVYRVAVNWVQIVLLGTAIPLFTCLFRVEMQPLIQAALIILVTFNFYNYLIWIYSNEKDIRVLKTYGSLTLTVALSLLVGWASFSVLFLALETFLRGIFVSSIFLLGMGYIQLYVKNSLSKKNVWDYVVICIVFGVIAVLFRP